MWRSVTALTAGCRGLVGPSTKILLSTTTTTTTASTTTYPRAQGIAALRYAGANTTAQTAVSFITEAQLDKYPQHLHADIKASHIVSVPAHGNGVEYLVSVGATADKVSTNSLRSAVVKVLKHARTLKSASSLTFNVPSAFPKVSVESAALTIAQSAQLANYTFDKYISQPKHSDVKEIILAGVPDSLHAELARLEVVNNATIFARDLANDRADVAHPAAIHAIASEISQAHNLTLSAIVGDDLEKNNLNLLAAVGQASVHKARLLTLEHWGNPSNLADVTLVVGKGITFDTGGLNLKPTGSMETMHLDKTGAVVTLAAAAATAKLNIPKNIVFVLALAENAIGERAYKPHAIIKSHKGLTVEIGNTDAEGRLALADALSYAQDKYKPTTVVDFATLTGACVVALGEHAAGLFSNDDALATKLTESGTRTFERVWRLPILPEHEEQLKNPYADTCSTGPSRYGGASTAAAFLKKFINDDVKWAHIDIAGPAMLSKPSGHFPQGGTGFGVQLIVDFLSRQDHTASK